MKRAYKWDLRNEIQYVLLLLFFVILLIPIVWASIYTRPCIDDFGYSRTLHEIVLSQDYNIIDIVKEAINTDIRFYKSWQGLYTSAFFLALQPGIFGENYYCIGAILLIFVACLCVVYFVKSVERLLCIDTGLGRWCFGVGFVVINIAIVPNITQLLYWYNGAWNYTPFFYFIILNIGLIIRILISEKSKCQLYIVLSAILSFFISGGNHVTAFLNIIVLLLINSVLIYKKKQYGVVPPLFLAIIGFIIMYKAPGTTARFDTIGIKAGFFETILASLKQSYEYVCAWMYLPWILCAIIITMIVLPLYSNMAVKKVVDSMKGYMVILIWIISFLVICAMNCVPYYAMRTFGDYRLINIVYLTFFVLSQISLVITILYVRKKIEIRERIISGRSRSILLFVLLCFVLLRNGSYIVIVSNDLISGKAKKFGEQYDERYELMRNSDNRNEVIYVDSLVDCTLKFDDISSDVNDWRNQQWKSYYGCEMAIDNNL